MDVYPELTVDELRVALGELEIKYNGDSQSAIDAKKVELGGLPPLLEEYFIKIGWFDEISNSGMGCHIDDLDSMYIMKKEEIIADFEECENEVDDYLIFGRESVSVDEFGIKVRDFDQANPIIYSLADFEETTSGKGLLFGTMTDLPNLAAYFSLVLESAKEA